MTTEAMAMRRFFFLLPLILMGCGSDGTDTRITLQPTQHVPEISNLTISPDDAFYMENDGSVEVAVEISFTDLGRDIETLRVAMSDGTSLEIPVSASLNTVSGTLTEVLDVTTADIDGCTIELWVVDSAGQDSNHLSSAFSVIKHTPRISSVNLSPDSASYMEGDGSLVVSAEVTFVDAGRDIQTLWVRVPDGTRHEFEQHVATETGTLTADFAVSTATYGEFTVTFQLVDEAGIYSTLESAGFDVIWNEQESNWTNRLGGLPYVLNDVIWDGDAFVAVGTDGSILTSVDGFDWVARESGTAADLNAVASYGPDIIAVGDEIVLLSTDHGQSWTTRHRPAGIILGSVAVSSSMVVAGGNISGPLYVSVMISEDRGGTWQAVDWSLADFIWLTDVAHQDGLFVWVADSFFSMAGGWIFASPDGTSWNEIFRNPGEGLNVIVHAGTHFIVAGRGGVVLSSVDGFNWTERETPVAGVDYLSAAWNGSTLVVAGGYSCWHFHYCSPAQFDLPVGLASADGGVSWDVFNIDGQYQSRGLAFGNGRFVSVGQSTPISGEGAIYTAN